MKILKKDYESFLTVNYFLLSSLRFWDCMDTLITSPRYFSICIIAAFQSETPSCFCPHELGRTVSLTVPHAIPLHMAKKTN